MRDRLLPAAILLALSAMVAAPVLAEDGGARVPVRVAAADGPMTAALGPGAGREARPAPLPQPLSDADATLYRRLLRLQGAGSAAQAEREAARIGDPVLLGHVKARRLLADGARPRPAELRAWLSDHADHPQADAVFRLAGGTRAAKGLKRPVHAPLAGAGVGTEADGAMWEDAAFNGDDASPRLRGAKTRLRQALRQGDAARVGAVLAAEIRSLPAMEADRLRLMVAADHFAGGRDDEAAALAGEVAGRSGDGLPAAHWVRGLALWRMGRPEESRRHFEAAVDAPEGQEWLSSAAAFWAGRANLLARRPEAVNHWLEVAATYPRTFYGMLARAQLGYANRFGWETPPFTEADADALMRVPGARRALALVQLGERAAAEDELRHLYPGAGKALRQSLLALARAGQMPSLAVRLGGLGPRENGRLPDAAAYPVPDWKPQGGWQLDRALVYALVRQESGFNPAARSAAGATGLMQLMPNTASAVAGRPVGDRLADPEVNLGLGQRYVARLLGEEPVNGDLLLMAAAYNAGPGNLSRWLQGIRHGGDPLLAVESLPSRETRVFVQRVMTSYWIYQNQLGQNADALVTLAGGLWPDYEGQDQTTPRNGPPARTRPSGTD